MCRGVPEPAVEKAELHCGRVRLSRLGFWSNPNSEEIDFSRIEFSVSLGACETHEARWRMHSCCVALTEHAKREFI